MLCWGNMCFMGCPRALGKQPCLHSTSNQAETSMCKDI